MDKTYQELELNSKQTVGVKIWDKNGEEFYPSGAYYTVKGTEKQNTVVSRRQASVNGNRVYTQIGLSVTTSAAEYDLLWEIRKDKVTSKKFHCTKLLVNGAC